MINYTVDNYILLIDHWCRLQFNCRSKNYRISTSIFSRQSKTPLFIARWVPLSMIIF